MTKKFILSLLLLATSFLSLSAQPKREVRAVWLTTIGGLDWPHNYARQGLAIEKQQQELRTILDKLQKAGINTVLLQAIGQRALGWLLKWASRNRSGL